MNGQSRGQHLTQDTDRKKEQNKDIKHHAKHNKQQTNKKRPPPQIKTKAKQNKNRKESKKHRTENYKFEQTRIQTNTHVLSKQIKIL